MSGSLTNALKGTFDRASALPVADPTRPVAPVNKIMFPQISGQRLFCVTALHLRRYGADQYSGRSRHCRRKQRLTTIRSLGTITCPDQRQLQTNTRRSRFLRFWPIFWSRPVGLLNRARRFTGRAFCENQQPYFKTCLLATTGRITSGTYNSIDLSTSMRNPRQTKARSPTIVLFVNKGTALQLRAGFSRCGRYRYWLRREWDNTLPQCAFIGLNPSTADAQTNDPTLRRCMGSPDNGGMDPMLIGQPLQLPATDPAALSRPRRPGCQPLDGDGRRVTTSRGSLGQRRAVVRERSASLT